ncbi:hypothetical protein [Ideonella alba]|uniref:Uncharacterized protein n=1 Tax=Ideonella alba TaxID=2824118 RepID=A0A941BNB4_9BURK|nr:hypothetical protein [Ideonella alba]MBQ0933139.1 hypothetical protein [Ideonella alba]
MTESVRAAADIASSVAVPASTLGQALDLLTAPALWVATLVLLICWLLLALLPIKRHDKPEKQQDIRKLFESLREYASEHKFVFNVLMGITSLSLLAFTSIATILSPKTPHAITYEDLFLAVFAGVGGALLILVMTDYASKRYFAGVFEQLEPKLTSIFTSSQQSAKIAADYGLHAFPSAIEVGKPAVQEFQKYLLDDEMVCVSASSGMRWLNRRTDARPIENNLAELAKRPVCLRIAIYSPLLELKRLFSHAGLELTSAQAYSALKSDSVTLSQHNPIEILRFHLDAAERILNPVAALPETHARFRLEVQVCDAPPVCEFFTIADRRLYASYPMRTRQSLDSPALHVYDPPKLTPTNLVSAFTKEFALTWRESIPFSEYYEKYAPLIREIIKLSIDDYGTK